MERNDPPAGPHSRPRTGREALTADRRARVLRHPTAEARGALARGATAIGAAGTGAVAVGAFAVGALAVGALAIGVLAIRRLTVREARLGKVRIEELEVGTLKVRLRATMDPLPGPDGPPAGDDETPGGPRDR